MHILSDLHPTLALADFIRDIKTASSIWLKESKKFPEFEGWADGYALRRLLIEHGIEVDERYFP